jgi:hypothetical protein
MLQVQQTDSKQQDCTEHETGSSTDLPLLAIARLFSCMRTAVLVDSKA